MAKLAVLLFLSCLSVAYCINPILFFPGYSLSKLQVTVTNGTIDGCPTDGTFAVEYQMAGEQNGFSNACMMKYLEILHSPSSSSPSSYSFSNRPDVSVSIPGRESGNTECFGSPLYNKLTNFFVSKGYTINSPTASFLGACFDWRMDPSNDVLSGPTFLENTKNLVESSYAANGNQKVWLIGHSNGPIQALHFLNTLTDEYKKQYIAGFIPISGNFAGQGLFPVVYVQGLSLIDFSFLPETAVIPHSTWTASYFSGPQPAVFNGANSLSFLSTNTPKKDFYVTEADLDLFFDLTNNTFGKDVWRDYAGLVGPHTPPKVYTFALWGYNVSTLYGVKMESFDDITIPDDGYFFRDGDGNQEDIDNESPLVWASSMPKGCFESWEVVNVDHFKLNENDDVLNRLYQVVSNPPSIDCTAKPDSTTTTGATSSSSSSLFASLLSLLALAVLF